MCAILLTYYYLNYLVSSYRRNENSAKPKKKKVQVTGGVRGGQRTDSQRKEMRRAHFIHLSVTMVGLPWLFDRSDGQSW